MRSASEWEAAGMTFGRGGTMHLTGAAEALFRGWKSVLHERLGPFYEESCQCPVFIDREMLEAAQYIEHFPQHVIHAHGSTGSGEFCMSPAACFHVYPMAAAQPASGNGFAVLVNGTCARFEGGAWDPPFRLSCFHMTEVVVIGSQALIAAKRRAILAAVANMFSEFRFAGSFVNAVDAFYLAESRGARLLQQMKGLKKEFQAPFGDGFVALASVNDHEEYFGRRFGIRDANGDYAHSLCAAFGLERLTAIGLSTWGSSPENWPEDLRP